MLPVTAEHAPRSHAFVVNKTCILGGRFEPPQVQPLDHQALRKRLLSSLSGQTIRIPNLAPLFKHWPTKTNTEVHRMRDDIRDWLNWYDVL
jgi:hypothetical protein